MIKRYHLPWHPPSPALWRRRGRIGRTLLCLLVAVLGVHALFSYLNRLYEGQIYPHVSIAGVDVGGRTPAEAHVLVAARLESFERAPLTLSYRDLRASPTLADLGVTLDLAGAVEQAYGTGRQFDLPGRLRYLYQGRSEQVALHLSVDGARLQAYLHSLAARIDRRPVDAGLTIGALEASVVPARPGVMLLVDETAADLLRALSTLQPRQVALRTRALEPTLGDAAALQAKQQVDAILRSPLTLSAEDQRWKLNRGDLRPLVQVWRDESGARPALRVGLDQRALGLRLAELGQRIERAPSEPTVRFGRPGLFQRMPDRPALAELGLSGWRRIGDGPQVLGDGALEPHSANLRYDPGSLYISLPGRPGARLDVEASLARINEALAGAERSIELAIEPVLPAVHAGNLDTLGIKEVVAVGQSSFKGSAEYRITNIKAGTRLLDGALIAPGAEFSFNERIGEIGPKSGFVEGYAIVNNRTQKEFGGGICQTSTTLFRAAFHAGLPITERHEHSFRISWYEVFEPYGMDAAIFTGQLDLRFVNDTGHWLLLQTEVDDVNQVLTYTLYGTRPNREVLRSDPILSNVKPAPTKPLYVPDPTAPIGQLKQTDTARGGMDITIWRIIKVDGQEVSREAFVTRFKPWPNIYIYNPRGRAPRT